MNKIHATAIAAAAGLSVVLGGVALSRSGGDEAASPAPVPVGTLSARAAQLDRLELALDRRLGEAPTPPGPVTRFVQPPSTPSATSSRHDDEYEYDQDDDGYEHAYESDDDGGDD